MTSFLAENLGLYRGHRWLFRGIGLVECAGMRVWVQGTNGSGKTSLLHCLAGLLAPSEGVVHVHNFGYAGHGAGLKNDMNAAAHLALWHDLGGKLVHDYFGVHGLAPVAVGLLSAGERQKLNLTRLMMWPRNVWLLDEPFANLDRAAHTVLHDAIMRHTAQGGMVIMASHDAFDATHTIALGVS